MRCFHPEMPNATSSSHSNPTLGILSFETAKAISRLIALHNSLSKDAFSTLRSGPVKSVGVTFLNSDDETYLLAQACVEKLQDLDRGAATIAALSRNCLDKELLRFGTLYQSLKLGKCDFLKFNLTQHRAGKMIERMQKLVTATANLHNTMGALREVEMQEKKVHQWKKNSRSAIHAQKANLKVLTDKILLQKRQAKRLIEISIWNQTFDTVVQLMSQITFFIFVRICIVFGPFVSSLPRIPKNRLFKTGPPHQKQSPSRVYPENFCRLDEDRDHKFNKRSPKGGQKPVVADSAVLVGGGLLQSAKPNTLGGLGLALRYANVIMLAERFLGSPETMNEEAREHLWGLLPGELKQTLRGKLKSYWCKEAEDVEGDEALAADWATAVEKIMGWLAPVAHDTVWWQQERTMERQRFDAKPTVLLMQTLHFSDVEKTEAAIVEVLVGLTCIFRAQMRRRNEEADRTGW